MSEKRLMSASFGSLARFKDVERIFPVGESTLIAYSGDVSDAQHIQYLLDTLMYSLGCLITIGSASHIIKMTIFPLR
jgi:20S proteasome alpha/beta subunit